MRARLKVDYYPLKKGDIVEITEINKKFVSCNGVDFGHNEIQIVTDTLQDKYEVARFFCNHWVMRPSDITKHVDKVFKKYNLSISKKKLYDCIYSFIFE